MTITMQRNLISPGVLLSATNPEDANETEPTANHYIPGVCNIGKKEIQRRKVAGWTGLILTIVTAVVLIGLGDDRWWRLIIFIPAMMGATGFIQAYFKFCVYFGFWHLFNFGETGKTDTIEQAAFRTEDRARAWKILVYAVGVAIAITLLFYFIPR